MSSIAGVHKSIITLTATGGSVHLVFFLFLGSTNPDYIAARVTSALSDASVASLALGVLIESLLATYYLLLTTYYLLLTTYYLLLTTYYLLLTTYYLLLTTYYLLLTTTYYILRTTHYLLLTTDY